MYYYAKYGIERVPIGLFSEDYPTLRDRQVTKIVREFPAWLGELKETQRDGLAFYLAPQFGSGVVMLRNLDDPSKYASVEFAAILVEELTKNQEETFEDLRTRLRFPGIEERKFVGATNPGQVGHGWVKRKWVKVDPQNTDVEQNRFFFIPAKYSDNSFNPSDYGLQLSAITDPQKRKALLDGSWDVFAGQFFDEWNPHLHEIRPFIPVNESVIVGGMDWGRSKPFSFHLSVVERVQFDEETFYRVKTFYEAYGVNKNPDEWSNEIKKGIQLYNLTLDDVAWVRADPAIFTKQQDNSVSIRDQFVDSDSRWRCIKPANNDRLNGWSVMHDWLSLAPDGKPYWQIATSCANLVRTLPDLVHDENHVEDVDTEGEDHCLAGDTLVLTTRGWQTIKDLPYAKITGTDAQVIKITTETGKVLLCTPNHKVLSPEGWVLAETLKIGSSVLSLFPQQFKFLAGSDITNADRIFREKVNDYILPFGNLDTAQLQKVGTSTMQMQTNQTTTSQTSELYQNTSTSVIIPLTQQIKCAPQLEKLRLGPAEQVISECLKKNDVERIISVSREEKRERVYDIALDHPFHGFIVNGGLIVHNSADDERYMLKHLKWIGTKVGGARGRGTVQTPSTGFFMQRDDEGRQISINTDKFTH